MNVRPVANSGSRHDASRPRLLDRLGPAGLVVATIAVSAVARVLFDAAIGFGVGEGYYVASARHLALSYFDQPPLFLWVTWLMLRFYEATDTLMLRLPFLAMFGVTTWLMFLFGKRLFGEWAGAWSAVILNLSLVFTLSVGSWVQPDAPLFLFLLAAALCVSELAFGEPRRPLLLWCGAGAAFGLALLSKYHAALTLLGLLIFVATTPGYRAWFMSRGLLCAAVIATVIFSPVLIWNAQNEWVSFLFQGERAVGSGLHPEWLLRSILGQGALIGVLIWPPLMVVFFKALRQGPADPKSWFLCCLGMLPLILFTVVALWAPLGLHFHWQAPGYVFLFPLLGRAVADRMQRNDRPTRNWLLSSATLMAASLAFVASQAQYGWVHAILPSALKAGAYADTNPTHELLKWDGLRAKLVEEGLLPNDRLFAISNSWKSVGRADTELGDTIPVVTFSNDPRNIAFGWDDRKFLGWDALIITTGASSKPPDGLKHYFADIRAGLDFDVRLGGDVAEVVRVFVGHNYRTPYPLPLPPARVHDRLQKRSTNLKSN